TLPAMTIEPVEKGRTVIEHGRVERDMPGRAAEQMAEDWRVRCLAAVSRKEFLFQRRIDAEQEVDPIVAGPLQFVHPRLARVPDERRGTARYPPRGGNVV